VFELDFRINGGHDSDYDSSGLHLLYGKCQFNVELTIYIREVNYGMF